VLLPCNLPVCLATCPPHQDYVIAQFPHGAFPLGALLGGTFMATEYPGYYCYATAASSAFYVPIWRHVHAWLGTEVCTKTNFHHLLGLGVKGPLPHRHHHHHHSSEQQQQQQDEQQQLSSSSHAGKGTPFASATEAAAAAAEVSAGSLSASCKQQLVRRRSLEQLLQSRQSSQLGLAASIRARFRHHHSLSDTESSDSESECEQRQGLLRRLSIASDASSTTCTCCSTCSVCACGAQQQQQQSPQLRGHSSAPVRLSGLSSSGGSTRLGQQQQPAPAPAGAADALLPPPDVQKAAGCGWQVDPATGQRKTGVSVGLMVGGIAEMFMIRRDHERIKLKDRKGFVRIALEHGVPILPVYMFGANQVLDFGPPWLQRLSRRMRASVGMIYGAWGLPIPRRLPIFKVTGRPLEVGPPMRKDHPNFAARVDEIHGQFIEEIQRIYYTHRAKYGHGFENRPLVIC
jgi:hypothetical protein